MGRIQGVAELFNQLHKCHIQCLDKTGECYQIDVESKQNIVYH